MEQTTYPLAIPYGVVLTNVAQFNLLMGRAEKTSSMIEMLLADIDFVVRHLQEVHLPELTEKLNKLKVQFRQMQRGVAVHDAEEINTGPEVFERTLVESQACVRLWKRLVQRIHPDKGGDPRTFNQAVNALKNRDLRTLQFIWDAAVNFSHPGWKSSNVGYAQDRLDHLTMQLEHLRMSRPFEVVKAFRSKRIQDAVNIVRTLLEESILRTSLDVQVLMRMAGGATAASLLQEAADAGVVELPFPVNPASQ